MPTQFIATPASWAIQTTQTLKLISKSTMWMIFAKECLLSSVGQLTSYNTHYLSITLTVCKDKGNADVTLTNYCIIFCSYQGVPSPAQAAGIHLYKS